MTQKAESSPTGGSPQNSPYIGQQEKDVSIPQLLRQLGHEVSELFSKEISLARAEVRESLQRAKNSAVALATGGIVLLAGIIVLLMAAVYGLATILELWLSALIVGGSVSLIGFIMCAAGKRNLTAENFKPERTIHAIQDDKQTVKGVVR